MKHWSLTRISLRRLITKVFLGRREKKCPCLLITQRRTCHSFPPLFDWDLYHQLFFRTVWEWNCEAKSVLITPDSRNTSLMLLSKDTLQLHNAVLNIYIWFQFNETSAWDLTAIWINISWNREKNYWNAAYLLECILWRRMSHLMGFIQIGLHNPKCNKDALCGSTLVGGGISLKCMNFFSSSCFLHFVWFKSVMTNYAEL